MKDTPFSTLKLYFGSNPQYILRSAYAFGKVSFTTVFACFSSGCAILLLFLQFTQVKVVPAIKIDEIIFLTFIIYTPLCYLQSHINMYISKCIY